VPPWRWFVYVLYGGYGVEPLSHDPAELAEKRRRVDQLLADRGLDALLLSTSANVAWASGGGRPYIFEATDGGVAALLYRRSGDALLLTSSIERDRLVAEEMPQFADAVDVQPWYEEDRLAAVRRLVGMGRLGADAPGLSGAVDCASQVAALRASLLPAEVRRYRWLGRHCGAALEEVAGNLRSGVSEHELAGGVASRLRAVGITPVVLLVAADDRITRYRHPLPTDYRVRRYAMVVVCGRRWGLIAAATRIVHLGPLPDDLRRRHGACVAVDAAVIAATRSGVSGADLFARIVAAYAEQGYPDEWQLHHQGGSTGYQGRDWLATPSSTNVIVPHQAFAWNPSITGTKSEDTFVLDDDGQPDFLTATGAWPTIQARAGDAVFQRPAILEVGA